jgi:hypothetical protein
LISLIPKHAEEKMKVLVLIVAALMVLAGCGSSVSVTTDYDKEADFGKLKSFAWMDVPTTAVGDVKAAAERNTLLDKRIKAAVNKELETKGYEMNEASPDFVMMYHVGIDDKINVTDWGYGYPSPYWGGHNVSVYQYTQGTLILDIVDPVAKQLIWRGEAQGTVDPDASPEDREYRLGNAVTKLLESFPPGKAQ